MIELSLLTPKIKRNGVQTVEKLTTVQLYQVYDSINVEATRLIRESLLGLLDPRIMTLRARQTLIEREILGRSN